MWAPQSEQALDLRDPAAPPPSADLVYAVQVTLVGKVVGVSEDQLTFNLQLDDGTGRMAVKMYANADDSDVERQNRSELREGIYVRVFGHIGSMHTERHISAFSARPIADHNEVTYHLSQVIFQHLHLTKGGDAAGAPPAAAAGGFPAAPGYGAAPAAMAAMPAAGGANGLNPIQADVLAAFSAPDAAAIEVGLSVDDVAARTGGRFNKQQIMAAVTYLQEDGQLYSTVDDAHWKACC